MGLVSAEAEGLSETAITFANELRRYYLKNRAQDAVAVDARPPASIAYRSIFRQIAICSSQIWRQTRSPFVCLASSNSRIAY